MSELPLTPTLFKLLSGFVEEKTGVHYAESGLDHFSAKVWARLIGAGFASPLDYYYYLRYDAASAGEFDALVDELVVNETYFFREPDQLRSLCDDVVLPLVREGQRPRVWCAAASTGEEPLSVAMLLAEAGLLEKVEIVATDISLKALACARRGEHGPTALRVAPKNLQERWMRVHDGRVTVAAQICERIDWRRLNLLDEGAVASLGTFDAILCRNVLIYFRDETIRRVVGTLSGALSVGGRLFVGASESLIRFGTSLHCQERNGAFSYFRTDP